VAGQQAGDAAVLDEELDARHACLVEDRSHRSKPRDAETR
jgi:hypothetical protein